MFDGTNLRWNDGTRWQDMGHPDRGPVVRSIFVRSQEEVWIATSRGLDRFSFPDLEWTEGFSFSASEARDLGDLVVMPDGDVWAAYEGHLLVRHGR